MLYVIGITIGKELSTHCEKGFEMYTTTNGQPTAKVTTAGFSINATLSFNRNDEVFLGIVQVRLLKQVMEDGSIHAAAKSLKMSYQHAWHMLDKVNKLSPIPVIIRQKGGRDGGGCSLSPYGIKLIQLYDKSVADISLFLQQDDSKIGGCFL